MTDADWNDPLARALALVLDGDGEPDRDADGRPIVDDDLLVLVNGWWEPLPFTLPPPPAPPVDPGTDAARAVPAGAAGWRLELDTHAGTVWPADAATHPVGGSVEVGPRSVMLLVTPTSR